MTLSRSLLYCALLALLPTFAVAQEAGDNVIKEGTIKEDLYLAGGTVDVLADVTGDVIAAGGTVTVDNAVSGDVIVGGGTVAIRARVGDDVRAAGGNVAISGPVKGDAVAAGGRVLLARTATVGERAWLAGGSINVAGQVGRELRVGGGEVVISGEVGGNVEVFADELEVQPGAVIKGNLVYHSRNEARIAGDAKIAGTVTRRPLGDDDDADEAFGGIARLGFYVTLMVAAVVLYLLFPLAAVAVARTGREAPWKSLGLGLAVLAGTPLVIVLLMVTLIGLWLGLITLVAYFLLLLLGFLVGVLTLGDLGLRLVGRDQTAAKGARVLAIVVASLALWIIGFVPILGGLVGFVLLLFGLGALMLFAWRRYTGLPGERRFSS